LLLVDVKAEDSTIVNTDGLQLTKFSTVEHILSC